MDESHIQRIREQLKQAGVTAYGLLKSESRYLPNIISKEENIGGVIYGQNHGSSVMLIATDKRVIYLDRKPFFTTMDELTYDVISGVRNDKAGGFASITLYTRVANYSIGFANKNCVNKFIDFMENKRITQSYSTSQKGGGPVSADRQPNSDDSPVLKPESLDAEKGIDFLKAHELGVFSSQDRTGNIHGAVVYYTTDIENNVFILTKSSTAKSRNVYAHSPVALTVHEAGTLQTVQLQGMAEVETDQNVKQRVFDNLVKARPYRGKMDLPPITKIHDGSYSVIRITPTVIRYHNYSNEK